jgi:hypothetical protein
MTNLKAGQIINEYGKLLGGINSNSIFQPIDILPFSKATIKFAFYIYIYQLIGQKKLNKEGAESLMIAYAHLNFFIESTKVEMMNQMSENLRMKPEKINSEFSEENINFIKNLRYQKEQSIIELQEYISDCLKGF